MTGAQKERNEHFKGRLSSVWGVREDFCEEVMCELKLSRHLANGDGPGEWEKVPERGTSIQSPWGKRGWQSVVIKRLVWQKRKKIYWATEVVLLSFRPC